MQLDNITLINETAKTVQDIPFALILFSIWIAGIIVYLVSYFIKYKITSKKIRRWSIHVTNKEILSCFMEQKKI